MNIHFTDFDIVRCARAVDNLRLSSAVKENVQMLCTAGRYYYHLSAAHVAWAPTHYQHPCTQWLTQALDNVEWLYRYTKALEHERLALNWQPMHTTLAVARDVVSLIRSQVASGRVCPPSKRLTALPNCARRSDMGIDFTYISDTRMAYRQYMCRRWEAQVWAQGIQWRPNTGAPAWATDYPQIAPNLTRLLAARQTKH